MSLPGACPHDCPDRCAWVVTVEDDRAVNLVGDPTHPFTRGTLCAKVNHYLDRVYSPDRILYPLCRTGAKGSVEFERVSWDDALACERPRPVRCGCHAVGLVGLAESWGFVGQCADRRWPQPVGRRQ